MMTRPRTHYILPAVLLSVLAILILSDVGNAVDTLPATGSHEVRGSIPLGSTNIIDKRRASIVDAFFVWSEQVESQPEVLESFKE